MRLDPGPAPGEIGAVPQADLPSFYRSRYRIKPDRRFLYAVEEIDRLASGRTSTATLSVRFDQDTGPCSSSTSRSERFPRSRPTRIGIGC